MRSASKAYRRLEYWINPLDVGRWEWIAYPEKAKGVRLAGCVDGTREKAVAACKVALDDWLAVHPS